MFNEEYEVLVADNEQLRCEAFRIRYQVYCLERGFEDPARFPTGEETDEYDADARHFLVRSLKDGRFVATARAVVARHNELPMSRICRFSLRERTSDLPRMEVSRVSVVKGLNRRTDSAILALLVQASVAYGVELGLPNLMFLTSPAVARLLRRLRLPLIQLGPLVEHRGMRAPFRLGLVQAYENLFGVCAPQLAEMAA
ncbi:MAG: GNAT family N-acetyltransferase [Chromatiales bacterium]|nr:GNAT family N-acetyltransferase [Chromatiales bacterium]